MSFLRSAYYYNQQKLNLASGVQRKIIFLPLNLLNISSHQPLQLLQVKQRFSYDMSDNGLG